MTLSVALSSAVSSLLVVENQMGVASNNISNANTVGYTQQQVNTAASASGSGVLDLGTSTYIDQYLQKSMASASATSSQASTLSTMYQTLQQAYGQVTLSDTGNNNLASQLSTLQATVSQLGNTPQQASLKAQTISDLDNITSNMNSDSSQIQALRASADSQISATVADVNTQLATINSLNQQIEVGTNTGQTTATLEDQRTTAMQQLSSDIGVNYYTDSSGATQIYSEGGAPLLVGNQVVPLSHTATATMSSSISYPGGIGGIMSGNTDITSQINTGTLGALIKMRDTELPNAQASLDSLAQGLSSSLNTISNQGTASPPPQALTGGNTTPIQGTDPLYVASGTTVRVAVVDSLGNAQGYDDINLDTAGVTDVNDMVSALNTGFAGAVPPVAATASLNAQGQLVLSANNAGQGVAITTLSGSVSGSPVSSPANPGTGFSSYFQLNNLLTGGNSASTISVRSDILQQPNLLPAGKLASGANPGGTPFTPFVAVTAGDGSVASAMSDAMLNSQSFSPAGYLGAASTTFSSYATNLISDVAMRASDAQAASTTQTAVFNTLQQSYSSETGVNVDEQTAALTSLQNIYAASARVVSTVETMFQALITAVS